MIIYLLLNIVNKKAYIGQHLGNKISGRWPEDLRGGNRHLEAARQKYGWQTFSRIVLYQAKTQYELDCMETFFIVMYQSFNPEYGYNMTMGGNGGARTEECKQAMRRSAILRQTRTAMRICYGCFRSFNAWQINNEEQTFCSKKCAENDRQNVPCVLIGRPSKLIGRKRNDIAWNKGMTFNRPKGVDIWITDGIVNRKWPKEKAIPLEWKTGKCSGFRKPKEGSICPFPRKIHGRTRRAHLRICYNCFHPFASDEKNQVFCSNACAISLKKKQREEQRLAA